MSKSILQPNLTKRTRECYFTGKTDNIHRHHIFSGTGNRQISDKYGFWVWLDGDLHNGNHPDSVHGNPNKGLDLKLKQDCQRKYEETNSREDFLLLIGKSYL